MENTNILEEVRAISSKKIAEKQKSSELNYPKIIEKIKKEASYGVTSCTFQENEIDQYTQRLLQNDGFTVYVTSQNKKYNYKSYLDDMTVTVWIVKW